MGDVHDGVNFMRAACVIAVEKAQQSFEPMLESLRHRSGHIMRRLFPVVESMLRRGGFGSGAADIEIDNVSMEMHSGPFKDVVRRIYDKFVEKQMELCISVSFGKKITEKIYIICNYMYTYLLYLCYCRNVATT